LAKNILLLLFGGGGGYYYGGPMVRGGIGGLVLIVLGIYLLVGRRRISNQRRSDSRSSARDAGWRRRVDHGIVTEMKIAVGFQMSIAEEQFLESYVAWRRQNPIKEWWLAESRKHREPGPLLLFGIIDL
jgi:hypothetical protein